MDPHGHTTEEDGLASHVNRVTFGAHQCTELEKKIVKNLRTVFDPEIPINIYDLGLIYGIRIGEDNKVTIEMTLTAPNCPAAETLPVEATSKTLEVDEVEGANVELVWEPTWGKSMMSEAAKLDLGL